MGSRVKRGERLTFTCTRCGKCCSSGPNVTLTAMDVCRIAKYFNTSWRELAGKYLYVIIADYTPVIVLRGINDKCVFLKTQGKITACSIYPARPMRCRLYPFIPIAPGKLGELEVSSRCPGVGVGELSDPPWGDLEEYMREVREHYTRLYDLIFNRGYDPLSALEITLSEVCGESA